MSYEDTRDRVSFVHFALCIAMRCFPANPRASWHGCTFIRRIPDAFK
jgi:hypothetical protein